MPDCEDTSAQVPLYNEIQATTTFASLALFFFLSLHNLREPLARAAE